MTDQAKQPPVETLRDGSLKAAVWENESERGTFYSVTFARTDRDGNGNPRDTASFSGPQLLRLARLADEAYQRPNELRDASSGVRGDQWVGGKPPPILRLAMGGATRPGAGCSPGAESAATGSVGVS